MSDFHIRVMQKDELNLALEWASEEGWNPGLDDAACYYQADTDGFLVGVLNGELIACIAAIKYSNEFAFIGFYLVKPEFRGKGFGIRVWQAALDYLQGCNIGLDGVSAQQANYQSSGFQLAYSNVRYQGKVLPMLPSLKGQHNEKDQIVSLKQVDFNLLIDYEKDFFPCERHNFLKKWIKQENSQALAYFHEGKLVGYGVMRQCREGFKVAPLFADSPVIADALLLALLAGASVGDTFYLDVPECHQAGLMLAKKMSMEPVFATARMYTSEIPLLPLGRIYGVTSFEIG